MHLESILTTGNVKIGNAINISFVVQGVSSGDFN